MSSLVVSPPGKLQPTPHDVSFRPARLGLSAVEGPLRQARRYGSRVQPLVGDRAFRNQVVRLADLTVNTAMLENYTFANCRVVGPAVLVPLGNTSVLHCIFGAPDVDSIFWEVPESRDALVGAVGALNCTFSNCQFEAIGWAGPPELRELFQHGVREIE